MFKKRLLYGEVSVVVGVVGHGVHLGHVLNNPGQRYT